MHMSDFKTFTHENKSILVNLDHIMHKEWQVLLKPFLKTKYFTELLFYVTHYIMNENGNTLPKSRSQLFMPFLMSKPQDVKAVIFFNSPTSTDTTGIAFGTNSADRNHALELHENHFSKTLRIPQIIDSSLNSWVKQGALLLNQRPLVDTNIPGLHVKIFDLFHKNILAALCSIREADEVLLVGTLTESNKQFVEKCSHLNIHHLHVDGYFPEKGPTIYELLNSNFLLDGKSIINWSRNCR